MLEVHHRGLWIHQGRSILKLISRSLFETKFQSSRTLIANVKVQVVPTKDLKENNGNAEELNIHLNPCLLPPPTSTSYLHVGSVAEVLGGVLEVLTGLVRPTNVLVAA